MNSVEDYTYRYLETDDLDQYNALLRYTFQVTEEELTATGWKDEKLMDEKIVDVLDKVGLKAKGFKMPYELSGGEQQRVDIARALLNSPKLILADEPTGNLDPETSDEIMQLLVQISRDYGTTIVMATHDYIVIHKFPGRLVRTERGRVIDNASISMS